MRDIVLLTATFSMLCSCATPEKDYVNRITPEEEETAFVADLVINEFAPKSETLNEFGEKADWIELYNNSEEVLEIKDSEWSLTDDENDLLKYILPAVTIQPGSCLLIWCDEADADSGILHAPFKLKGNGETIYLCKNGAVIDEITYDDDIKKSCSYGRLSDGSEGWEKFKEPTPGASNMLLEHYAEAL
jgi:hypothetical protein